MDVIEAIHGRRSVRSYDPRPVGRELIESVILDAAQAPPPFRGQVPWAFNVVEGVARIATYGARAMDYTRNNRPAGTGWDWLERPGFKIFWDAPVLIIISGPVGDCCRAGQNLMPPEIKAELGIPSALTPVAVFCLGYPTAIPEAVVRERPGIIWQPES